MIYKIEIMDEVKDKRYFVDILREIADKIDQGYNQGFGGPEWAITGEDEEEVPSPHKAQETGEEQTSKLARGEASIFDEEAKEGEGEKTSPGAESSESQALSTEEES